MRVTKHSLTEQVNINSGVVPVPSILALYKNGTDDKIYRFEKDDTFDTVVGGTYDMTINQLLLEDLCEIAIVNNIMVRLKNLEDDIVNLAVMDGENIVQVLPLFPGVPEDYIIGAGWDFKLLSDTAEINISFME